MDRHMNLFHFYGESEQKEKFENNLTKGLALSLKYDVFFLNSFISLIDPTFSKMMIPPQEGSYFDIDIQVKSNRLEAEKVIAVSITVDDFSEKEYKAVEERTTDSPTIDMVITYADTVVICEVKPSKENCLAQLKNQVSRYKSDADEVFCSFSWKRITTLLERITNLENSMGTPNLVTCDYLNMLKGHFPSWQPIPKLNELTLQTQHLHYNIEQRLIEVCKSFPEMDFTTYKSRISFQLDWSFAAEMKIQPFLPEVCNSLDDILIEFRFWAGDTKKQGCSLFKDDFALKLLSQNVFNVGDEQYTVDSYPYFKVSSFQRGVVWFKDIKPDDYLKFNKELFLKVSGRKKRDEWPYVDSLISQFSTHWKEQSKWNEKIEHSNRSQVDISMGVGVKILVPLTSLLKEEMAEKGLEKKIQKIIDSINTEFG